jgi:hypothetical protein
MNISPYGVRIALATFEHLKKPKKVEICPNCDYDMVEIQPCHVMCFNCGAQMDCSDKGTIW